MTPTPEQVAQWAQEADPGFGGSAPTLADSVVGIEAITRLVTRAMAEQAEADAKLCDEQDHMGSVNLKLMKNRIGNAIRTNAPKVTT